jgi:hypothetical protein
MRKTALAAWLLHCLIPLCAVCQGLTDSLPAHYLQDVRQHSQDIDHAITRQSAKYLDKLSRLETKIFRKLQKADSNAGGQLPAAGYQQWAARLQGVSGMTGGQNGMTAGPGAMTTGPTNTYVPGLDTLATTLKFLQHQQGLGANSTGALSSNPTGAVSSNPAAALSTPLGTASAEVQQLQGRLNVTNLIQQYISQRRQVLTQLLSQYTHLPPGVAQAFSQYKATAYYYHQQIEQYKAMLNDPQKIEQKAVALLSQLPAYQQFLAKNSLLASLFRLPAGYGGGGGASTQGLQTQSQLQQVLKQQMGGSADGGGTPAVQQQLQSAASRMSGIQSAVSKYGAGGQELNMPSFQPNGQKTRTFLQRLQYGANLQVTNSSYNFPTTVALGLALGYKINDKNTAGVGLSYNVGMGSGWNDIRLTNQGLGLRSYGDFQIKKTYYIVGGYELNYMTQFASIKQLQNRSAWQPSALIGLEKKYRISSKLQGNMQLLFDALYRQEIPQGQMFKFRVGYNF